MNIMSSVNFLTLKNIIDLSVLLLLLETLCNSVLLIDSYIIFLPLRYRFIFGKSFEQT